jgi:acyl carrier protein
MGLDTHEIDDETRLFSSGLLDSFSMVDLIFFIEENAKIRIKPTEVNLDNLDSIQRILNFTQVRGE